MLYFLYRLIQIRIFDGRKIFGWASVRTIINSITKMKFQLRSYNIFNISDLFCFLDFLRKYKTGKIYNNKR